MTTIQINQGLSIVKFNGERFQAPGGYYKPTGHALKHPELGFVAFGGSDHPYQPRGGRKALKAILEAGGFNSFDGMNWLKPMA